MAPFGEEGFRASLAASFGPGSPGAIAFQLHVEARTLQGGEDARLICARAVQTCDVVLLVLDGSASIPRHPFDAPVLELELMLAAVCAKPVFVIDASNGEDPLFQLLGSEFFAGAGNEQPSIENVRADSQSMLTQKVSQMIGEICAGQVHSWHSLPQGQGWERLYLARPDRSARFSDDGGNFPFSTRGLRVPDMDLSDVAHRLDLAEQVYPTDQFGALVHSWDAVRALSRKPWASPTLDAPTALLWLRGWKVWGGAMSWLGLFGHSSAAALMANQASLHVARSNNIAETRPGGPFSPDRQYGGLASAYFSLSRLAPSRAVQVASRVTGIRHATRGLESARDRRSSAGLLAVRGALRLSGGVRGLHGLFDLHASERLHLEESGGDSSDTGLATARVQLGAAYKEIARRTWGNHAALSVADGRLTRAYEVLHQAVHSGKDVSAGQLLMCMKHLIETRLLQGRETAARDLWDKALEEAARMGLADQHRQLREIGRGAKWLTGPVNAESDAGG